MGTCKNMELVLAWRKWLNGSTIPVQVSTLDLKLTVKSTESNFTF